MWSVNRQCSLRHGVHRTGALASRAAALSTHESTAYLPEQGKGLMEQEKRSAYAKARRVAKQKRLHAREYHLTSNIKHNS